MKGAFICTLSESDWTKTRELGVYGNRFYKEGTSQKLGDVQQLFPCEKAIWCFFISEENKRFTV
jgi:hypothetical protein